MRSLRSILLTGGAGFIGSNLARHLLAHPEVERLVVLDRLTGGGQRGHLIGPDQDPRFVFVQGDLADQELLAGLLDRHQVTGIFNLAAETPVGQPDAPSEGFLSTNIGGTHRLLEAARHAAVPLLQCSTDEVYGSIDPPGKFTEESPLLPASLYAATKASADLLCLAAASTGQQEVVITRSSNNYGPHQHDRDFIPALVAQAVHSQALTLSGTGSQIRDWIHVDDHCRGMIMAFTRGPSGHRFNFGGNCERTMLGMARSILSHFGKSENLLRPGPPDSAPLNRAAVDSSKAGRYFAWTPKIQFQTGFPSVLRELAANLTASPHSPPASRWEPPRPKQEQAGVSRSEPE